MSLAIGVWESPTRYLVASDRRITADNIACMRSPSRCKLVALGGWHAAWAGALPGVAALVDALREPIDATRKSAEEMLAVAWRTSADLGGAPPAFEFRRSGVNLLLVGPAGLARMDSFGCIDWHDHVAAIGCAEEYALGYLDAAGTPWESARRAILAAADRYVGVGDGVDVAGTL